ncbi:MAG: hotdog fold thioesterase [Bdellovibrionia bacterium]
MQIWQSPVTVEQLNQWNKNTIHTSLGIVFTAIGDSFLEAKMPVDERTKQPLGLLHGGASVVLAESLGSVASALVAGSDQKVCVGLEINASHLKSVREGYVIGRVTPVRLGQSIHVWDIVIRTADEPHSNSSTVCQSRLTVLVRDRKQS